MVLAAAAPAPIPANVARKSTSSSNSSAFSPSKSAIWAALLAISASASAISALAPADKATTFSELSAAKLVAADGHESCMWASLKKSLWQRNRACHPAAIAAGEPAIMKPVLRCRMGADRAVAELGCATVALALLASALRKELTPLPRDAAPATCPILWNKLVG
eukprot:CAMPEP_0178447040 /NCGR_PEP_ID=MMETSP0689_2-20121128/41157_1 /TAXON_ID=160604 /ORGANISM="Amphidinium massartii, Strain CS-259" /LENGTH=163 /DNA_ID=CAMNT_0020071969 /DNA_START=15 /DNA_END=502 /DNA_ORIENTATION=-